jgi:Na+/glutamate symporter
MIKLSVLVYVLVIIFSVVGWGMNLYKFVKLDFKSPYKAEVIRAVGVATGLGAVTGYININD